MARAASAFRQTDVQRAVKAAQAAGVKVGSIKITPDGTIEVVAENHDKAPLSSTNEWDGVQ